MKKLTWLPAFLLFCASAYGQGVDVLVQRYDNGRTGQNLAETALTVSNVNSTTFGKVYTLPVDGFVYAQPLYKSNLFISGKGTFNVVFMPTQHDSVYAFDADTATPLWQASFLGLGITPQPSGTPATQDVLSEVGITGTPVIDPATNTMYVVAKTIESGASIFRIHALDIRTGVERLSPVLIQASVPGTGNGSTGGILSFNATYQFQRPGLVLANGTVYVAFGSSADIPPYTGWVLGYNPATLAQVAVFCVDPNGLGGGIWAPGEAPPVDSSGNIFVNTGNGDFNGSTNFGDSIIKLSPGLSLLDYFAPFNQAALSSADLDIAAAGFILLPDSAGTVAHPHILVGGGKDGTIYVLDRDRMGNFNGSYSSPDSQIIQEIWNQIGGIQTNPKAATLSYVQNNYTTPAFWQNHLYWCGADDRCKMFNLSNGLLTTTPVSQASTIFPFAGGQPVITAGSASATSAILWVMENGSSSGVLHAYNASNLASELYNSNQAPSNRDTAGQGIQFAVPTVANGKVFAGAQFQVDAYGLLASAPARLPAPVFSPVQGIYNTPIPVSISDLFGSNRHRQYNHDACHRRAERLPYHPDCHRYLYHRYSVSDGRFCSGQLRHCAGQLPFGDRTFHGSTSHRRSQRRCRRLERQHRNHHQCTRYDEQFLSPGRGPHCSDRYRLSSHLLRQEHSFSGSECEFCHCNLHRGGRASS